MRWKHLAEGGQCGQEDWKKDRERKRVQEADARVKEGKNAGPGNVRDWIVRSDIWVKQHTAGKVNSGRGSGSGSEVMPEEPPRTRRSRD
jgi:hypothetical protein